MIRTTAIGIAAGLVTLASAACIPAMPPAPTPPAGSAAQPYAGFQGRPIKALAPERIDDLLAGRGASYALAAELNRYPGPSHVLDFASELRLRPEQEQAARSIKGTMQHEARQLGSRLVELETELDRAFRAGTITGAELERLTGEIAATDGRLRATHLAAHLEMKELLDPDQVLRYDQLRGYAPAGQGSSASGHTHQPAGPDQGALTGGAAADHERATAGASEWTATDQLPATSPVEDAGVRVE